MESGQTINVKTKKQEARERARNLRNQKMTKIFQKLVEFVMMDKSGF